MAFGGVAGWFLHDYRIEKSTDTVAFAHRAVVAHIVYAPEVRHPVEVGAEQEAHLVAWLSKRIGGSRKDPQLARSGIIWSAAACCRAIRVRSRSSCSKTAADSGLRFMFVKAPLSGKETAFRYAQERGISVFYWVDGRFGYAISGELNKAALLRRGECCLPATESLGLHRGPGWQNRLFPGIFGSGQRFFWNGNVASATRKQMRFP